jgi:hypothetical protein
MFSKKKYRPESSVRLCDSLNGYVEKCILPKQKVFESIKCAWKRLLPAHLRDHSRIADIYRGRLTVVVDTAPYQYELQLRCADILEQLQRLCPNAKLTEIRLTIHCPDRNFTANSG